jgi:hypothetical protein
MLEGKQQTHRVLLAFLCDLCASVVKQSGQVGSDRPYRA